MRGVVKNLTGLRFGRLTAVDAAGKSRHGSSLWRCLCDCGKEKIVPASSLLSGSTSSCGCLRVETFTKHGRSRTKEYNCWAEMKQRCHNPNNKEYHNYGGRGIVVCEYWLSGFENFLLDMGEAPSEDSSLDRIDVNKGYYKDNCRWTSVTVQRMNIRTRKDNKSGFVGIRKSPSGKYVVKVRGKYVGRYETLQEAVEVRAVEFKKEMESLLLDFFNHSRDFGDKNLSHKLHDLSDLEVCNLGFDCGETLGNLDSSVDNSEHAMNS